MAANREGTIIEHTSESGSFSRWGSLIINIPKLNYTHTESTLRAGPTSKLLHGELVDRDILSQRDGWIQRRNW